MKNLLIFLLIAATIPTVPTVGYAAAEVDLHAVLLDAASHLNSAVESEDHHANQDADCCHSVCVCCVAPSSIATAEKVAGRQANANKSPGIRSTNLPNPHLEGLLRPPRFS